MSHAHRKHVGVKRQGAAVRQRRIASLTVMPFPPIVELSLPPLPPPSITFPGRISTEALRKIAEMFPMEGERP